MKPKVIWLKVTHDKYELPIAIADTAEELAKILGCSANNIYSSISHNRSRNHWTPYRKVEVKDNDQRATIIRY